MLEKREFKIQRPLKIILETQFYVILTLFISCWLGLSEFTMKNLAKAVLAPFSAYWFIMAYLFLLMLSPVLNCVIADLKRPTHKSFCLVLAILCFYASMWEKNRAGDVIFVIYIYVQTGYMKKYRVFANWSNKKLCRTASSVYILAVVGWTCFAAIGLLRYGGILTTRYALIPVLIAMMLVQIMLNCKPVIESRLIQMVLYKLAGSTLAVYVLQENMWIGRWIEEDVFHFRTWFDESLIYAPYTLLCAIATVLLFGVIDIFRKRFIEYPLFCRMEKCTWLKTLERFFNSILLTD